VAEGGVETSPSTVAVGADGFVGAAAGALGCVYRARVPAGAFAGNVCAEFGISRALGPPDGAGRLGFGISGTVGTWTCRTSTSRLDGSSTGFGGTLPGPSGFRKIGTAPATIRSGAAIAAGVIAVGDG
jgi:hypothetical protein